MGEVRHRKLVILGIAAVTALAGRAFGQYTINTLVSFNGSNGANPVAGLTLSGDGTTFYGVTTYGGVTVDGEVFSVPVTGGTPTVLASFNGSNGESPISGLTLSSDGTTLYGTTAFGGANNDGEVFSLPITGGTPTLLASFNGSNGRSPRAGLSLASDGTTFYGTTALGGANNDGEVFSLPVTGGTPTLLASFNGSNGESPFCDLTLSSDGTTFYGTTAAGGANNNGGVFSLPVTGGTPTLLASFNYSSDRPPYFPSDLTLSGTALYGITAYGGAYGEGTVFAINVPEPGSVGLLAIGSLALLRRVRRIGHRRVVG
jgi:uncharacterized repeat protein (TIGR03803 family)